MFKLITKDLSLQSRSIFTYILMAAAVVILFSMMLSEGHFIIYVFGLMLVINVTFRAAHEDDRNKGFAFLCSLPLRRATVVYSKFAGTLLFILVVFGAVLAIDLALSGFEAGPAYWTEFLPFTLFPSGMLILLGIFWLLFFKLGYIRATNIVRFLFLAPLVAGVIAVRMAPGGEIEALVGFQPPLVFAGFFALCLLFYGVMLAASLAVFRKAELG